MRRSLHDTGNAIVTIMSTYADFVKHLSFVPFLLFVDLDWQIEALGTAGVFYMDTCHNLVEGGIHITTLLCDFPNAFNVPCATFLHKDMSAETYESMLRLVSDAFSFILSSSLNLTVCV